MKRLLLILMLVLMPLATAYYWDSSLGYYGQKEYYEYEKSCIDWEELACDSEDVCSQVCSEYSEYKVYPPKYAQVDYDTSYGCSGEEDDDCSQSDSLKV